MPASEPLKPRFFFCYLSQSTPDQAPEPQNLKVSRPILHDQASDQTAARHQSTGVFVVHLTILLGGVPRADVLIYLCYCVLEYESTRPSPLVQ
jgi:hypothetical protein